MCGWCIELQRCSRHALPLAAARRRSASHAVNVYLRLSVLVQLMLRFFCSLWPQKRLCGGAACYRPDANLDRGEAGGGLPPLALVKIVPIVLQYVAWPQLSCRRRCTPRTHTPPPRALQHVFTPAASALLMEQSFASERAL